MTNNVVVAFSGGKDSTAMLLRMLELGEHIDEIVFADPLFEFPELYDYLKRIELVIGRGLLQSPLSDLQIRFENGFVPSSLPKYTCWSGCEGVKRAFEEMQCDLFQFNGVDDK